MAGAPGAIAQPAVGVVDGTNLLAGFDTALPGTFTSLKHVTGLAIGERLVGVDYRHHPNNLTDPLSPPELFGVGAVEGVGSDTLRLYRLDPGTGAATQVGAESITVADGLNYGIDFNPTADRVRMANDVDDVARINPNNGARSDAPANDSNLLPAGADISGVAHDRVEIQIPPTISSNTTVYAIGTNPPRLYTIGDLNQTPESANGGLLKNPMPLGIGLMANSPVGFDIAPDDTAFASLVAGTGQPGLYTVNLGTGAATLIGSMPEGLSGLAIVPQVEVVAPPQAVVPDTTAPVVTLGGLKGSMSLKAFLKGVAVEVTTNEPAALEAELLAAARTAKLASFNLIVASATASLAPGKRTLKLKPGKRLVGKPSKAFKVSLRVTATDTARNAATVTKTITVKPAKKKKKKPKR